MKRPVAVTVAAVLIGLTVDLLMGADPPGYAAALGLGGCILIIVASKWLGKVWLQRPQDYYQREPRVDAEREPQGEERQPHA